MASGGARRLLSWGGSRVQPVRVGRVSIQFHAAKTFNFKIPAEMYRLAAVGIFASLVTTAVIYSCDGNIAATPIDSRPTFQQPKDWVQAEGRFTPTPNGPEASGDKPLEIANAFPLPRPRPATPGYYYELVRAQGDGEEGDYVVVERRCIPKVDMPQPCYLPERGRQNFPIRRE
jgi:hypothetical protein